MSAERPPAAASQPHSPATDEPSAGHAAVPPEPADQATVPPDAVPGVPQHTVESTRTSMVWTMTGVGLLLLAATLVFILQNSQHVRIRFLMASGTLPLGVGLLFAALLGALLVLTVGAARVLQLRRVARRHRRGRRRADQASP